MPTQCEAWAAKKATRKKPNRSDKDALHVYLEPESRDRLDMIRETLSGVSLKAIVNAAFQCVPTKVLVKELIARGDMPDPTAMFDD